MSLLKRIKRLEKQFKGDTVSISFTDGSHISASKRDMRALWINPLKIPESPIYKAMKAKYDEGIMDKSGLIHTMMVYEPGAIKEVWADEC